MPVSSHWTEPGSAPMLSGLLEALGTGLIDVIVAPKGLDVPVAQPLIFDQMDSLAATTDDLLLAVGTDPASSSALDVVEAARQVGASGVVFKIPDHPPADLTRAAESAKVALLGVPVDTGWGQLLTLLQTARGAGANASERGGGLQVGDLFGLANAIAATVGGATTIEDLESNVLAYSTLEHPIDKPRQDTILGRRVPTAWSRALVDWGVFRKMYRSGDVVRVQELIPVAGGAGGESVEAKKDDYHPRLAIVVRAGGEALGSIWVMEGTQPLTAAAEESLRAAAQIAAVHMLHHRAWAERDRQQRAELLRSLLEEGRPAPAVRVLRLTPGAPLTVLAFAPDLAEDDEAEVALERLAGLITLHMEVYRRHAHTVLLDEIVYVLLSDPDLDDRDRVIALADELRKRTELSAKTHITVGIGSAVIEPRNLHRSRAEADQVLQVLRHRNQRVGHVDDLRGAIALMYLEELMAEEPLLHAGKVERLLAHDLQRKTNHAATLRAFLDCFGDVVAAADSLNIHRNTFRYRLGRLVEVAGLDLDDPEERLITHLQLRLLDRRQDP